MANETREEPARPRAPAPPHRPHPAVLATAWMMGTLASFMTMAVAGRELSRELGTFEILFFRSFIGLGIVAVLLLGERLTGTRVAAIGLGFAGMLIILRPGLAVVDPAALMVLAGNYINVRAERRRG